MQTNPDVTNTIAKNASKKPNTIRVTDGIHIHTPKRRGRKPVHVSYKTTNYNIHVDICTPRVSKKKRRKYCTYIQTFSAYHPPSWKSVYMFRQKRTKKKNTNNIFTIFMFILCKWLRHLFSLCFSFGCCCCSLQLRYNVKHENMLIYSNANIMQTNKQTHIWALANKERTHKKNFFGKIYN